MKTYIRILSFIFFIASMGTACTKNNSGGGTAKSTLTLSSQTVKIGQPLIVGTDATGSDLFTRWSVNPPANALMSTNAHQSVILFSKPGVYKITANYFTDSVAPLPYDSSSSQVTVTDSIYNDSVTAHCNVIAEVPISAGDLITLTPVSYSDSGILTFVAHTQETYGLNSPSLGWTYANDTANAFNINFPGITEFPCSPANAAATPATGSLVLSGLGLGTYNLSITLNGNTYEGSFVTTPTSCTITWNYTQGIVISPLVIQQ